MVTIPANTIFRPFAPTFALQSDGAAATLSTSVDGGTFTAQSETFTGTQSFTDYNNQVYLKCDVALSCTCPVEFPVLSNGYAEVSAPTHGQIKLVDFRTKQLLPTMTILTAQCPFAPVDEKVECIWFDDTCKYRFVKWTIGGVDYFEERPVITLSSGGTSVAITLVELPR